MLVHCYVFLCGIFYVKAMDKAKSKDKSINLALETVLEFNNKDHNDIKILDNIQEMITKVKTVIDKNNIARRSINVQNIKFTNFLQGVIEILKTYEDNDLEQFIAITNDEARKFHYRGCKFYELTENYDLRRFLAEKLDSFNHKPAKVIRKKLLVIARSIGEENYGKNQRELIDYINSLYRTDSVDKFKEFLNNIDNYKTKSRRNVDLKKIVRAGLRSIVFDHYSRLNHNARIALKSKIEEFWNIITKPQALRVPTMESFGTSVKRTPHLKHTTKFNNAGRTLRQMYVEKNLDLKYDPYAYDHLTTNPKIKTKKKIVIDDSRSNERSKKKTTERISSIKTFQKKHTDTDNSKEDSKNMSNDPSSMELSKQKLNFDNSNSSESPKKKSKINYDDSSSIETNNKKRQSDKFTSTESEKSTDSDQSDSLKKSPKYSRNTGFHKSKKHDRTKIRYDSDSKTKRDRTTKEDFTYRQMYVEKNLDLKYNPHAYDHFTPEVRSKLKPSLKEYNKNREKFRAIKKTTHSSFRNRKYTLKVGNADDDEKRTSKRLSFIEVELIKPTVPRRIVKDKKIKIAIHVNKGNKLKTLSQESYLEPTTKPQKRFKIQPSDITNYRRYPVFSEENLSLEEYQKEKEIPKRKNFRRFLNNHNTTVVDNNILNRIQELESQLKVVKNQIKNDTEIIKRLDSKVREGALKEISKFNEEKSEGFKEYVEDQQLNSEEKTKIEHRNDFDKSNFENLKPDYKIEVSKINEDMKMITPNPKVDFVPFSATGLVTLNNENYLKTDMDKINTVLMATTEKQLDLQEILNLNEHKEDMKYDFYKDTTDKSPDDTTVKNIKDNKLPNIESRKAINNLNLNLHDGQFYTKLEEQFDPTQYLKKYGIVWETPVSKPEKPSEMITFISEINTETPTTESMKNNIVELNNDTNIQNKTEIEDTNKNKVTKDDKLKLEPNITKTVNIDKQNETRNNLQSDTTILTTTKAETEKTSVKNVELTSEINNAIQETPTVNNSAKNPENNVEISQKHNLTTSFSKSSSIDPKSPIVGSLGSKTQPVLSDHDKNERNMVKMYPEMMGGVDRFDKDGTLYDSTEKNMAGN